MPTFQKCHCEKSENDNTVMDEGSSRFIWSNGILNIYCRLPKQRMVPTEDVLYDHTCNYVNRSNHYNLCWLLFPYQVSPMSLNQFS